MTGVFRQYQNLDADTSLFLCSQLEYIKAKAMEIVYPELLARRLFPVDYSGDSSAQFIHVQSWDQVGMAKIINYYANDLPNVALVRSGPGESRRVYGIGVAFGYSIQDIRAARATGLGLEQRLANAARYAYLQKENELAMLGDTNLGIPGFVNNPNTTSVTLANNAAGTSKKWADKTADEIIKDIGDTIAAIRVASNGVETPNTLLLPEAQYTKIATTPRAATSDVTILEFVLQSNPFITAVIPVYQLKGAGAAATDVMIAYDRNPDKVSLVVTQDFEVLPAQEKAYMFEFPCHGRTAGVILWAPKSVAQANGI